MQRLAALRAADVRDWWEFHVAVGVGVPDEAVEDEAAKEQGARI